MPRRPISPNVVENVAFKQMSLGARLLYIHMCLNADNYGFVSDCEGIANANRIKNFKKVIGELLEKNYIIEFKNSLFLIKHWFFHNTIVKEKYSTVHSEELAKLYIKENGAYTFDKEQNCEENREKAFPKSVRAMHCNAVHCNAMLMQCNINQNNINQSKNAPTREESKNDDDFLVFKNSFKEKLENENIFLNLDTKFWKNIFDENYEEVIIGVANVLINKMKRSTDIKNPSAYFNNAFTNELDEYKKQFGL